MNGILGFLENSTGQFLSLTVEALQQIGAKQVARCLEGIQKIMETHGVTNEKLQDDQSNSTEFQITSFSELHGEELEQMCCEIEKEASVLTDDSATDEPFPQLLYRYVEQNRVAILHEVNRIANH